MSQDDDDRQAVNPGVHEPAQRLVLKGLEKLTGIGWRAKTGDPETLICGPLGNFSGAPETDVPRIMQLFQTVENANTTELHARVVPLSESGPETRAITTRGKESGLALGTRMVTIEIPYADASRLGELDLSMLEPKPGKAARAKGFVAAVVRVGPPKERGA